MSNYNYWFWDRVDHEQSVYQVRALDSSFWSSYASRDDNIRRVFPNHPDKVLGFDLFNTLYQWELQHREPSPNEPLKALIDALVKDEAIQELRQRCVRDPYLSVASTMHLYRQLMRPKQSVTKDVRDTISKRENLEQLLKDDPEQLSQVKQTLDDQEHKQAERIDQLMQQRNQVGMAPTGTGTKAEDEDGEDEDKEDNDEAAQNEEAAKARHDLERSISQSATETLETLDAAEGLVDYLPSEAGGQGLDDHRSEAILDLATSDVLARTLVANKRLRELVTLMGRMRQMFTAAKSEKPKPAPTPMGITKGNDLEAIIPSELALLVAAKPLFYKRYTESDLIQYKRQTKPREGRGPVVVSVDISGSMSNVDDKAGIQFIEYAKALTLNVARLAQEQHRECRIQFFASQVSRVFIIKSAEDVAKLASYSAPSRLGYGTDFDSALTQAVTTVNSAKGLRDKADIVLITDGAGSISHLTRQLIQQTKDSTGARLFGLLIAGGQGGEWDGYLAPLLDIKAVIDSPDELSWVKDLAMVMV